MSAAPGAPAHPGDRFDRWQPWIAGLLTAVVHLCLLLAVLLVPPLELDRPRGEDAAGGSVIQVEFIGEGPETPAPEPEDAPSPASDPAPPPAAASRLQATPAPTRQPLPLDAHVATAPAVVPPRPGRGEGTPSAAARPSSRRPGHTWGQPPGMAPRDHAPVNAGPAPVPTVGRGQRQASPSDEPGLEAGGYQVVYEPSAEARLREWREQGMTELFIPLPGTRRLMVCPLETVLRRESGPCRQLDPDDPELAAIGDAREVIAVRQVYREGRLVWRGPGAYR